MRENNEKHRENLQLKQELTKLQKKYGEEKVSDNYFEDPHVQCQTPSTRRTGNSNFGAIGLALFSLVSLIMVTNINVKDQNSVTLFNSNNNEVKTSLEA
jgi:hypothetical protein